jgi:hypothetical protein
VDDRGRRFVDAIRRKARQAVPLPTTPDRPSPAAEDEALDGVPDGALAGTLGQLAPEVRAALPATVLAL